MHEIRSTQATISPVIKSILVDLPVENAFRLFTQETARWWPLATHSVFGDDAEICLLEGWVGGRFYEVHKDKRQSTWGNVLAWEPPHRIVFAFHPGRAPENAQEVEVQFQPEGSSTRVTLTHTGWERLGDLAQIERNNYDNGWDFVLGKYIAQASSPA